MLHLDGRGYRMGKHGFARQSRFAVRDVAADRATFTLADNAETRAAYPFAFRLAITFRLDAATLHTEVAIDNPGSTLLPASFGFHPAFAWPLPYGRDRADHRIVFADDEGDTIRILARDGTLAPEPRRSPLDGRTLHLADELFTRDALIWDAVRSDRVTYGASDGPQLEVAFPDTPALGIWTKPGSRYVCIEPWHGIADPQGYAGEFRQKPLVFEIAPGATKRIAMSVTLVA
jgi:galactose mutarotase-like enzyme